MEKKAGMARPTVRYGRTKLGAAAHAHLDLNVQAVAFHLFVQRGSVDPKPVSRVSIRETSHAPGLRFSNPFKNWLQMAP